MMNQNEKLNIPLIIRKTLNARFERKELIIKASEKVSELYKNADISEMKTRKGFWKIYIEPDYIKPSIVSSKTEDSYDRFCAVYFRGLKPLTIIRGNTAEKNDILLVLKTISRKVLEQLPFLSYPKKSLTEENGLSYGMRIGLIISIFFGLFIFFDYFLIPNYPEALLKGLNISFGIDTINYASDSKIFQYISITGRIIKRIFSPQYRHLASSMYTIVGVFIIPILFLGFIYEFGGKLADKLRMKKVKNSLTNYQYGFDVIEAILEELEIVKTEKIKMHLYNKLSSNGLVMEKRDFESLFNDVFKSK